MNTSPNPTSSRQSSPNPTRLRSTGYLLASVAALGLVGTACRIDFDRDFGETVTKTFEIEDFTELEVDGAFDVDIIVGSETSLEVQIGEDLLDDLKIEQSDDRLRIDLDGGWFSYSDAIRLELTTPDLKVVDLDGAVDLDLDGLDADEFELYLDGASTVTGEGSAAYVLINSDGASDVDFDDVVIDEVELDSNGASSISLNGASKVSGSIDGASSVDVSADTSVNVKTSGASSID